MFLDNLMIKDNNKFYQLDFKHAFNVKTFGIDGCRFAIPTRFKQVQFLLLFHAHQCGSGFFFQPGCSRDDVLTLRLDPRQAWKVGEFQRQNFGHVYGTKT